MSIIAYAICFIVAIVGAALHLVMDMRDKQITSSRANVQFSPGQFLSDQKYSIIASILWIILVLLVSGELLSIRPEATDYKNLIFAFLGYAGDSIASRLFGLAAKRLDAVIDDKTNQIDTINNTLDKPTPAMMPTDKKL